MYFMAGTQVAFSVYIIRLVRFSVEDADSLKRSFAPVRKLPLRRRNKLINI